MIEIVNLTKVFDGRAVLNRLNLSVRNGETMVIIGASGGGKTVLLRHIVGLTRPDEGQVIVEGKEISSLTGGDLAKLRLQFGMLFQGSALFDSLTVRENVAFALREHTQMAESEVRARVRECLELVGLGEKEEEKRPIELSGGMRKRVGLARALAIKPRIILYDEPTTGLDPPRAGDINELILSLNEKLKVTGVAVTHDMNSAYRIADRIAMLHEGKIIQVGTPDEIRATDNPIVRRFILGQSNGS